MTKDEDYAARARTALFAELHNWPGQRTQETMEALIRKRPALIDADVALCALETALRRADDRVASLLRAVRDLP